MTVTFVRDTEVDGAVKTTAGRLDLKGLMSGDGAARVAVTIGYATEYSRGKCSVTISLQCDQDVDMVDWAAEVAMQKADQLAVEGMGLVMQQLSKEDDT